MGIIHKEASAVFNDLVGGLEGYSSSLNLSIEQLEDELVEERLACIFKYYHKNLLPYKDLSIALRCIPTDCESLDRCCISTEGNEYNMQALHFQIPQLVNIPNAIQYIGSTDLQTQFPVYTNKTIQYHKYKMRKNNTPYVFIDTSVNNNNMMDGFIFNAPMLERITLVGIFKDIRDVEEYNAQHGCCPNEEIVYSLSVVDSEAKANLLKKKFQYYRQLSAQPLPNQQNPGQ